MRGLPGIILALVVPASIGLTAAAGHASTIDFEGPVHGTVIDQITADGLVLDIAVENFRGPDIGVVFDSDLRGTTEPDLEFDDQGNILIIQKNDVGCDDGICDLPDDQGAKPAGSFQLDFSIAILSFGLDLLDVEPNEAMGSFHFFVEQGGSFMQVGPTVTFEELTDPNSPFYDPDIEFGDNTANTVSPFSASDFGVSAFDRVVLAMGGSGGLDNLELEPVPEPGTVALVSAGLILLAAAGRRT